MAETLSMWSKISFAVAGAAFAAAVFLWIFFKIPRVIGDLSGRNARKSVAKVRASNEKSGGKAYRPSAVNAARGKLTSTMPQAQTGQPTEEIKPQSGDMPETSLLAENRAQFEGAAGTELLGLDTAPPAAAQNAAQGKRLHMLEEIMLIHTDEVIE